VPVQNSRDPHTKNFHKKSNEKKAGKAGNDVSCDENQDFYFKKSGQEVEKLIRNRRDGRDQNRPKSVLLEKDLGFLKPWPEIVEVDDFLPERVEENETNSVAHNPSPFVVLDEVEAALDEANTRRFVRIMTELSTQSQFIIVTHNRVTMHAADALYGVVMNRDGVSKLLSVKIEDVPEYETPAPAVDK
jgi:hypothetical protein